MLLKPRILINQVTYTTHHSQILMVLGLLITLLITGIFIEKIPTEVFADSKILKQDTK